MLKRSEAEARQLAEQLQGKGIVSLAGFPAVYERTPRIQMPGGAVITAGGELLVQALMNGGQPVD